MHPDRSPVPIMQARKKARTSSTSGSAASATRDMAISNMTTQQFLGPARKSWMTPGIAGQEGGTPMMPRAPRPPPITTSSAALRRPSDTATSGAALSTAAVTNPSPTVQGVPSQAERSHQHSSTVSVSSPPPHEPASASLYPCRPASAAVAVSSLVVQEPLPASLNPYRSPNQSPSSPFPPTTNPPRDPIPTTTATPSSHSLPSPPPSEDTNQQTLVYDIGTRPQAVEQPSRTINAQDNQRLLSLAASFGGIDALKNQLDQLTKGDNRPTPPLNPLTSVSPQAPQPFPPVASGHHVPERRNSYGLSTTVPTPPLLGPDASGYSRPPEGQRPAPQRESVFPRESVVQHLARQAQAVSQSARIPAQLKAYDEGRLKLLKEACEGNDAQFLVLHQLYCLSTAQPGDQLLNRLSMQERTGFWTLRSLLIPNEQLIPSSIAWFSNFPAPVSSFISRAPKWLQDAFSAARVYLRFLALDWQEYNMACRRDLSPPLAEQMSGGFGIQSWTLQKVLFTSLLRSFLSAPDDLCYFLGVTIFLDSQISLFQRQSRYQHPTSPGYLKETETAIVELRRQYKALIAYHHSHLLDNTTPTASRLEQAVASKEIHSQLQRAVASHPVPTDLNEAVYTAPPRTRPTGEASPRMHLSKSNSYPQPQNAQHQSAPRPGPGGPRGSANHRTYQFRSVHPHLSIVPIPIASQVSQPNVVVSRHVPPDPQLHARTLPSNAAPAFPLPSNSPNVPPQLMQRQGSGRVQSLANEPGRRLSHSPRPPNAPVLLFPPKGYVHPYVQQPPAPVFSLHQAHLRDVRIRIKPSNEMEPLVGKEQQYYTHLLGFLLKPRTIRPQELNVFGIFNVSKELYSSLPRDEQDPWGAPALRTVVSGTAMLRLRCVRLPSSTSPPSPITESEWAVSDTTWPTAISMRLNGDKSLEVRRKQFHGKDLAVDVTQSVVEGTNTILTSLLRSSDHPDAQAYFAVAVEILQITTEQDMLAKVTELPDTETPERIRKQLTPTSARDDGDDDGDIEVLSDNLLIKVSDPHSAALIDRPVRGKECIHYECFDLDIYIKTRRPNEILPESLRCPICGRDARPQSLRLDNWFVGILQKLKRDGRTDAKIITVQRDGAWSVWEEERKGETGDGTGRREHSHDSEFGGGGVDNGAGTGSLPGPSMQPLQRQRSETVIIELD